MNKVPKNNGFSLLEMLIATGIMTVGLVLIATIFPVAVKLTGLSAERSVAVVAADEAFAKIQLYGLRDFQYWPAADPNIVCSDFMYAAAYFGQDGLADTADDPDIKWSEFLYPSASMPSGDPQRYHWSALCRRELDEGDKSVQITVFVTSKTFAGMNYYGYPFNGTGYTANQTGIWPSPVKVDVSRKDSKTLEILTSGIWSNTALDFFDEGCTIVDDKTGRMYRVLEMKDLVGTDSKPETMVLWDDWAGDIANPPGYPVATQVWVVPAGVGSSRYPCVGVFQKVMRFDDIK